MNINSLQLLDAHLWVGIMMSTLLQIGSYENNPSLSIFLQQGVSSNEPYKIQLMASQTVCFFFMPTGLGITFIVCSYLHFLCSWSLRVLFLIELSDIKYFYFKQINLSHR